jgi:pyruvate,orthophosphate dikinase
MAHELALLQAARLKGRLSPDLAAASSGLDMAAASSALSELRAAGYLKGEPNVRLTPEGRARLAALVAQERAAIAGDALAPLYEEFDHHNTGLKQIISAWQLKDDEPNDHGDADYDQAVLSRLATLDSEFQPLVARIADVAPRLQTYSRRFGFALEQIKAGDASYVARPITDSYHTVWFEFHEELIGLLGLSREEEAAAGRAV